MNLSQYLRHLYDVLPTYDPSKQTPVFFSDLKPGDLIFRPHDFTWDVVLDVDGGDSTRLVTRRLVPGRAKKEADRAIYLSRVMVAVDHYGASSPFYRADDVTADLSFFLTPPDIRLLVECEEGTLFRRLDYEFLTRPQILISKQVRGLSVDFPSTPGANQHPIVRQNEGISLATLKVEVLDINDFVS